MTNCRSLGVGCRTRKGIGAYDESGEYVFDNPSDVSYVDPYVAPSTPSATTSWIQNLISGAFTTGEKILTAKTQTRGILTQTSPGVFTYVQPEGSQVTLPVGTIGLPPASGSMGLVLVAGVGVLVVFMLMKGKG